MNRRVSSYGFTLIELLVVLAIISLLAAFVFATLSGVRDKAKIARIAAQLRSLETSFDLVYDRVGCWPNSTSPGSECSTSVDYGWFVSSIYSTNAWNLKDYISGDISNFNNFSAVPGSPYTYYYHSAAEASDCSSDDIYFEGAAIYFDAPSDVYEKLEKIFDGTTSNFYARSARSCGRIQTDAMTATTSAIIMYKLGPKDH